MGLFEHLSDQLLSLGKQQGFNRQLGFNRCIKDESTVNEHWGEAGEFSMLVTEAGAVTASVVLFDIIPLFKAEQGQDAIAFFGRLGCPVQLGGFHGLDQKVHGFNLAGWTGVVIPLNVPIGFEDFLIGNQPAEVLGVASMTKAG
jgi:hypothetical protein